MQMQAARRRCAAVSRRRCWLPLRVALRRVTMTVLDVAISSNYKASWLELGCLLQLLKRRKMLLRTGVGRI